MVVREMKDFAIVNGELYYWGIGGVLAQALLAVEAKEEL